MGGSGKAPSRRAHVADVRPEYLALGFLAEASLHGYELYRRFEAELGQVWHLSQSQVYALLKRLEAQGFIVARLEAGMRSQEKRRLEITDGGRKRFEDWLEAPTDCSSRIIRLEFTSRLFFARRLRPDLVAGIVEGQRSALARQLANHERILGTMPPEEIWNRLSMDLRIRQIRSIIAWVEDGVSPLLLDSDG